MIKKTFTLSVNKILFITTILFFHSSAFSQCWNEVWADEFNGSSLDLTKWNYDLGNGCPSLCGWGNNEKQVYTSNSDNISVSGGYLNITSKYQSGVGGSGYDFTSAKIHTRDKHYPKYGRIEARMKLPAGIGVWPAFWMLPQSPSVGWPTSGEIDIMEFRGDYTNRMSATLHYGNAYPNNQWDGTDFTLSSGDFVNSFHVFAVEWAQGEIRWYVDNTLIKTETENPNSLNPASNNAEAWPWNNNFYLIINLAMGGWYTGNPSTSAIIGGDVNYSRTMQIDYVRVYEDISGGGFTGTISGKSSVLKNESAVTYTIPPGASATYNWSVTGSGSIVSGQGTNSITVDWGTTDGVVSVQKTLLCGVSDYDLPVTVQPTPCGMILEDFENIRYPTYGFIHGTFSQKVNNPAANSHNPSPYCARYIRNGAETYDVMIFDNLNVGNADDFERRIKRFMMDVYSNGAGRTIDLVLESSSTSLPNNYPTGRHSIYRATTTAVNAWETLTFEYVMSPDGPLSGTSVDRLVIMFQPNTNTSNTFYIDNLMVTYFPATPAISGVSSVCQNQTGISYNVSAILGSTYVWTIPDDATITSGGTGNAITVAFGVNSGNITVTETNTAGCTGDTRTLAVTVNNCNPNSIMKGSQRKLLLYPNPSDAYLRVDMLPENGRAELLVIDSRGINALSSIVELNGGSIDIEISSLPQGVYHLTVNVSGQIFTGIFTKF